MAAPIRHVREIKQLLRNSNLLQKYIDKSSHNTCSYRRFHNVLSNCTRNKGIPVLWRSKKPQMCAVFIQRYKSDDAANTAAGYIPEPPLPPPESLEIMDTLNILGEPTLASLGLGRMTPSGFVQQALEVLHVNAGLPWWVSIILGTVVLRTCMFPLVVLARRNIVNMQNHMPTIQRLQEKVTDCKYRGDLLGMAKYSNEMRDYLTRHKINPLKSFLVPMAQVPVFFSVFFGMRQMATLPVESLQSGGLFWFTDLSIPDPYYILPLITMATLSITLEVGADGVAAKDQNHTMKWVMRALPVLSFIFVCNFPTAMCTYWATSNAFSLVQVLILKIPKVQAFVKIPEMVVHPKDSSKKLGFFEGFKDSWENSKVASQVDNRMRSDAMRFKKAGEGPIPKTYPYDPAKVKGIGKKTTVSAKPKS